MRKMVLVMARLVKEADEQRNEDLQREIFRELAETPWKIPWMEKIEKVMVLEGEVVAENPSTNQLWEEFSKMLSEKGLKPEEYRSEFEEEWKTSSLDKLPLDEARKIVEYLARELISKATLIPRLTKEETGRITRERLKAVFRQMLDLPEGAKGYLMGYLLISPWHSTTFERYKPTDTADTRAMLEWLNDRLRYFITDGREGSKSIVDGE